MAKAKKGIFTKLVEGPERSEDYARKTLPKNRWSLGWDLIKTNFGKIMKINLLMFLFLFPIFLVVYLRHVIILSNAGIAPFSQNMGIGYPIYPFMTGVKEQIIIKADATFLILLFILSFYVSVGLAGGFYVIRNLVWTEGVFVASDFWVGVKKNYKTVIKSTLLFVLLFGLSFISIHSLDLQIALNPDKIGIFTFVKIISVIFLILIIAIYLFSLTLGVTYELKLFKIFRNAFILVIGLLPINLFFMVFSLIPFALLLFKMTSILFSFGLLSVVFFAISIAILIWTNYSQWVFDECLNDKIAGAKKNRGIYKKDVKDETEEFVYKKADFLTKPVKPITDYDVEIVELPTSFSRADLVRLQESKKAMIEDSDKYVKEQLAKSDKETDIDEFMSTNDEDKDN